MKKIKTNDLLESAFSKVKPEQTSQFVKALTDVAFERAEHLTADEQRQFYNYVHVKLGEADPTE